MKILLFTTAIVAFSCVCKAQEVKPVNEQPQNVTPPVAPANGSVGINFTPATIPAAIPAAPAIRQQDNAVKPAAVVRAAKPAQVVKAASSGGPPPQGIQAGHSHPHPHDSNSHH